MPERSRRRRRARDHPGHRGFVDLGWRPAIVLTLVVLVDRIETSIVPGVLHLLQEEWGFSDTLAGLIPTAVTIAGLLVILPSGYLADRARRTTILAVVVASWSIIITGSALALNFWMFFGTRVVLGAADNIDTPSGLSLLGDYYEPRRRSRAYGYHRMAHFAGGALGVLLGGVIGQFFGWRAAFFFMVIPGLIIAWLVWRLPEPERGASDRRAASEGVSSADAADTAGTPTAEPVEVVEPSAGMLPQKGAKALWYDIRALLKVRTIYYVYFGLLSLFVGLSGIFFWLPTFYVRTYGLGGAAAGMLTAFVSLVGIVGGAMSGGQLGDRWHGVRSGARIIIGGMGVLIGCGVLAAAFLALPLVAQVLFLFAAVFLMSTAIPNLSAAIADILPSKHRGIGFALVTFLMSGGGALGPLAVGIASDITGALTAAFYVLIIPMFVGAIVVLQGRRTFDADAERVMAAAREEDQP